MARRKTKRFCRKRDQLKSAGISRCVPQDAKGDLYPNCDMTIWLRSCDKEVLTPVEGTVTGDIPDWLEGSLLRNGPGGLKVGDMEFDHLFDSAALLHRLTSYSLRNS